MITKAKQIAYEIVAREQADLKGRARRTLGIRSDVFQSREVAEAYFSEYAEEGVKQLLKSVNGVADSNQLDYLQGISPSKSFEILVAYSTLRAADPSPEDEDLTLEEIMVESLRWSERLNKHPDSPFSQNPRFALIPTPTGNVSVGDEINTTPPLEEDEPE